MKKNIKVLLALVMSLVIMTGCKMRSISEINISADEKVEVKMTMAYGNETIDQLINFNSDGSGEHTDAERWAYLEESEDEDNKQYKKEKYEVEDYKGFTYSKDAGTLEELSVEGNDVGVDIGNIAESDKLFVKNGNEYRFYSKASGETVEEAQDYEMQGVEIEMTVSFTLPAPAKKNNASKVSDDKLTYTWDLLRDKEIELVFEMPGEEEEEEPVVEPVKAVNWASASKWALTELEKAQKDGLIPETFDKRDFTEPINRKDFAAVSVKLYEALTGKKAEPVKENPFTDTKDEYVLKAYNLEITKGVSNTTFSPDAKITREQMATMLTRALEKAGVKTEVDMVNVARFADDDTISSWALESVYFMSFNEIIKGIGNNNFGAQDNSTLEQALLISLRSVDAFKK